MSVFAPFKLPATRGSWLALPWRTLQRWAEGRAFGRLVLLAMLTGIVLVVPPAGAFPVDDDWIYAQTVRQLLIDGQYHHSVWIDSAFLAQAWWGAAVSWLFGLSHTTLRISTLLLAAVAVLLFHALLGRALRPLPALAVTLLLVFHPLFLHLSYTFMTDVPFLAIMLAALWCVTVATERPSSEQLRVGQTGTLKLGWLAAASGLIGLACLVRQIGVVLVPAVLLAALPELRAARMSRIRLSAALIVPFSMVVALLVYADPRDVTVEVRLIDELRAADPATLVWLALRAGGAAILLLGLSVLPAAPLLLSRPGIARWTGLQRAMSAGLLALLAAALWARAGDGGYTALSPLIGNTLSGAGFTVSGLHPRAISVSGPEVAMLVGGSLLGALALVVALAGLLHLPEFPHVPLPVRLLVLAGLGGLAVTLGYGPLAGPANGLYDRYLLLVLPGALGLVGYAVRAHRAVLPMLFAGVICFGWWSVSWQREYLERQTAVWQVADLLVAQGIPPTEIDAGYEWNGWHRGPGVIEQAHRAAVASGDSRPFVQLVVDGIYVPQRWYVGFGPLGPGCSGRPSAEASYGAGWPVYGLRRCAGGGGPTSRPPD